MKYNILYSVYTGGYPTESSGGPNNIIYKLIKHSGIENYNFDFLSSDLFVTNLSQTNIDNAKEKMTPKKKAATYFAERSQIYRKIFGSDFYLPYHFYKKRKYYNSFAQKLSDYHILHSQDSICLALLNNRNFKGKKILTVHSKGPLSDEFRNMAHNKFLQEKINRELTGYEKESINLADVILFPSFAAKNYFEKSLNVALPERKIKIIYNGIEFEKIHNIKSDDIFEKYSIDKRNGLTLLNIAAHGREKRIDILLRIVQTIKNKYKKNVSLINIGEGSDTKELEILVEELNIRNNVKFLGKIPNEDVIKFLKATDVFVMTSEKVIFDLVVLEALACGACCFVSNEGGNKEVIVNGENGYLIDTANIEESARKIISINPSKVRENAIKTAKQFTVHKMVDEYFNVYKELLDGV